MISTSPIKVKNILKVIKNDTRSIAAKLSVSSISDKQYCYDTLNEVSRSFALVIQDLPVDIKDAICIFYLVLRALDSIEDDMRLDENTKKALLLNFHEKCGDETFFLSDVGDKKEYILLLRNYKRVSKVFNTLSVAYQEIIKDICFQMAQGMIQFTEKEIETKEDYDLYCHYVAGLVGQGLSKMFVVSGLEDSKEIQRMDIANSMGLFLQKTNITRDFYEDLDEGRLFWPKEIWSNYTHELSTLKQQSNQPKSIACLNAMINNAFIHIEDVLSYLAELKNEKVFRFCAIPQVMAIGTLSLLYNNEKALVENVKLSKQDTLQVFANLNSKKDFAGFALVFLEKIQLKEYDISFEVKLNQIKKDLSKFL